MNDQTKQAQEQSAFSTAGLSSAEAKFYQHHDDNKYFHSTEFNFDHFLKSHPVAQTSFGKDDRYKLVAEILAENPVRKLLELGCGWGENCAHMLHYATEVTTYIISPGH